MTFMLACAGLLALGGCGSSSGKLEQASGRPDAAGPGLDSGQPAGGGPATTMGESAVANLSLEDQLRQRAEAYWKARVTEDWSVVYEYEPPAARAETTLEDYLRSIKEDGTLFRYYYYEIGKIEIQDDMGWIDLRATGRITRFPDMPEQNLDRVDTWRLIDGLWYPAMGKQRDTFPEPPSKRNIEEEGFLAHRFQEYWQARKKADYPTLYQFLHPADREIIPFTQFSETEAWFSFVDCRVLWTEVIGDNGRVGVVYSLRSGDPHMSKTAPQSKFVAEIWTKKDGVWYRDVPKPRQPAADGRDQ